MDERKTIQVYSDAKTTLSAIRDELKLKNESDTILWLCGLYRNSAAIPYESHRQLLDLQR